MLQYAPRRGATAHTRRTWLEQPELYDHVAARRFACAAARVGQVRWGIGAGSLALLPWRAPFMSGGTRLFSVVASWASAPGASPHEPCGDPGGMVDLLLEKAGHSTSPPRGPFCTGFALGFFV